MEELRRVVGILREDVSLLKFKMNGIWWVVTVSGSTLIIFTVQHILGIISK